MSRDLIVASKTIFIIRPFCLSFHLTFIVVALAINSRSLSEVQKLKESFHTVPICAELRRGAIDNKL